MNLKRSIKVLLVAVSLAILTPLAMAAKTSLTMGVVLEPPHLDPTAGAAAAIDEIVYANVFEGLTQIDQNGAVQPALAKSWTISEDQLNYTFLLRKGVTFHDGTDLNADDVIFSFKRATADNSVNAQKKLFEPIAQINKGGPHTISITLKRPTGNFLFNLGWGDAVIVAPESVAQNKSRPIGSGPFKFSKWSRGNRIELLRNDHYWGAPAKLTKAVFKIIPDPAAAVAAMMAGDIDAFANFPAPESLQQFQADPRFKVVIGNTEGETILSTNNAVIPFNNLKVRQAIAYALERQAIIDGAMFGYGTPIGSHFAPHHPAYVDLTGLFSHDLEQARQLMVEAGYANGFQATIKLPPPSYARRGGEIIAAQLKKIGIELEIIPVEWAQWLDQVFKKTDYHLTIVSHTEPMDIGIYARDTYYFNYHNTQFQALMQQLSETVGTTKRYAILAEAQKMITEDAVNGFLFQLAKHGVWNKELRGLWENSPVQANNLTQAYWANE